MIRASISVPRTASPPSYDTSEFPALVRWYQMLEAVKTNTTALADTTGNDTNLVTVENGTGDADANANALTSDSTAGNEVYATGGDLIVIGTNSLIIELDINPSAALTDGSHIIECGDPFSANRGFAVGYTNASGSLIFRVRNEANDNAVSSTMGNTPDLSSARNHAVIVWDRSVADPGSIQYYVNGALDNTYALSGTVGTNYDATGSTFKIGLRTAGTRESNCINYNVRIWTPSEIPSNISNIIAQMAKNPDELPSLMSGVS